MYPLARGSSLSGQGEGGQRAAGVQGGSRSWRWSVSRGCPSTLPTVKWKWLRVRQAHAEPLPRAQARPPLGTNLFQRQDHTRARRLSGRTPLPGDSRRQHTHPAPHQRALPTIGETNKIHRSAEMRTTHRPPPLRRDRKVTH